MPRLHSLLVSWRGDLLLERYYNGARATRLANIKSASKSVISALVGIAIDRKILTGVRQPIGPFFPELGAPSDAAKRAITLEDLLTMRAGLEGTSNRNYGAWVRSANWVRFVLSRELLEPPGVRMEYSTGNTHLLSAILTKATGKSTWQFAQDTLARPLGFSLAQWTRDPQGIYFGGNEMVMTPRQMLAFGELYRNKGRAGRHAGRPEGLGGGVVPAPHAIAVQRPGVRLRLVVAGICRLRDFLRVGLRRPGHLHRPRARSRGRDDVIDRSGRGAPQPSPDDLRRPRARDPAVDCQDGSMTRWIDERMIR